VDDSLRAHLDYFTALGVDGVRLEPEWAKRAGRRDPVSVPEPKDAGERVEDAGAVVAAAVDAAAVDEVQEIEQVSRAPQVQEAAVFASSAEALAALRVEVGPDCTRCKLHALGRRQVVFGVGNPDADLMFVGEAPGADEDIQGEPFVGRAGQLLTKIIEAIGMSRADVYIANVIKCRPPQNRNPEPDEVERCEPFLFRQIDSIKPKVIVALGKFAAQSLLKTADPITRIRGREYTYRSAILIPTYHPAFLLRNPSAKREVWEDMKKVRAILTSGADE
jgi:DNA polymerase